MVPDKKAKFLHSLLLNKLSCADLTERELRALEHYVEQERIGVRYSKGKTPPTTNFDLIEVEALKEELNQPTVKSLSAKNWQLLLFWFLPGRAKLK